MFVVFSITDLWLRTSIGRFLWNWWWIIPVVIAALSAFRNIYFATGVVIGALIVFLIDFILLAGGLG